MVFAILVLFIVANVSPSTMGMLSDEFNSASLKIIEKTGARLYKKFRVFEKDIQIDEKEISHKC